MLLRFSSLHRLLRVTAWCLRWRRKGQQTSSRTHTSAVTTPSLEPQEMDEALINWIRTTQSRHYHTEVSSLDGNHTIPPRSPLKGLSPFLDNNGVMRVGGRLKHASLPEDQRHPLIVPPDSWIARLLVDSYHRRTMHGGVQLTLGLLRQRFWIP
ncbi:hypothetical protein CAJAP_01771 [Camponotus japonicus]